MGYTHYYTQKRGFTNVEWRNVKNAAARIIAEAKLLQVRFDDVEIPDAAKIEPGECISFNGVGDDAHENFWLEQKRPARGSWQTADSRGFQFCKTARKPYDIAVAAVVLYLDSVYPATIKASSDGDAEDLQAGLDLARRALPEVADKLQMLVRQGGTETRKDRTMTDEEYTAWKIEFDKWMAKVDAALEKRIGLESGDLPDWCYADAFEDGREDFARIAREVIAAC